MRIGILQHVRNRSSGDQVALQCLKEILAMLIGQVVDILLSDFFAEQGHQGLKILYSRFPLQ
jgi:hypothetical protein